MNQKRLRRLPPRVQRFVEMVKRDCREAGVRVLLPNSYRTSIGYGRNALKSSGYFDSGLMTLAVGTRRSWRRWLPILVHEYCHFIQWKNGTRVWDSVGDQFLDWLARKHRLNATWATRYCRLSRDMELDCERRSVRMIRRYRLPVDLREYQRQSNAYLLSYVIMRDHRSWYRKPPYDVPAVLAATPHGLMARRHYNHPSSQFTELFKENCL